MWYNWYVIRYVIYRPRCIYPYIQYPSRLPLDNGPAHQLSLTQFQLNTHTHTHTHNQDRVSTPEMRHSGSEAALVICTCYRECVRTYVRAPSASRCMCVHLQVPRGTLIALGARRYEHCARVCMCAYVCVCVCVCVCMWCSMLNSPTACGILPGERESVTLSPLANTDCFVLKYVTNTHWRTETT